MRKVVRLGLTALSFVLLALLVLTTETAADELGFVSSVRAIVRGGWRAVDDWGYASWIANGFIFSLGAAAALWLDYWLRERTTIQIPKKRKITEEIEGKTFRSCVVEVDGKSFKSCVFETVTLRYNGGAGSFDSCEFKGVTLDSSVPEINSFMHMAHNFGLLSVPMFNDKGEVKRNGITDIT